MSDATYQRLTRERSPQHVAVTAVPQVSLWLGSDHLLLVERQGFTETCKRFYFRDIQAVIIQESSRRTIWNAILATPLAICSICVVVCTMLNSLTPAGVWLFLVLLFLVPLIINNMLGPACTCQVRTAVQTETLGSLSRLRQTRKVLEKIRPHIAAAQGLLTPEEASARMLAAVSGSAGPAATVSNPPILS